MEKSIAERRWAKTPLIESDGICHVPTYNHKDVFGNYDRIGVLYARCPFCKTLNDDDHVRLHEEYRAGHHPEGTCSHFRQMIGGCGAYDFVFQEG